MRWASFTLVCRVEHSSVEARVRISLAHNDAPMEQALKDARISEEWIAPQPSKFVVTEHSCTIDCSITNETHDGHVGRWRIQRSLQDVRIVCLDYHLGVVRSFAY